MSYYAYNPYIHRDDDYFTRNDFFTRFFNYLSTQMSLLASSDSKPQIIAYAAGAGLAAGVLIYVFGPTFFIDGTAMNGSSVSGKRKQTVVGLYNPANDCFVNSVLQALAGCGELRKYLGGRMVVQWELEEAEGAGRVKWKGRRPVLTRALKVMLDKLNERPLHRKTITTRDFIYELERVFRSRISRNQQDAQEFLQIVAQTLAEEYEAQEKVRASIKEIEEEKEQEKGEDEAEEKIGAEAEKAEEAKEAKEESKEEGKEVEQTQENGVNGDAGSEGSFEVVAKVEEPVEEGKGKEMEMSMESVKSTTEEPESIATEPSTPGTSNNEEEISTEEDEESPKPKPKHISLDTKVKEMEDEKADEEKEKKEEPKIPEFGMPMEGKLESGIQCLACGFEPKPTGSTFVVLTLNVPQKSSVTLNDCLNEHLSTEHIDDFQCAKCKLVKMISVQEKELAATKDEEEATEIRKSLETLNHCLENDPENIPKDTLLPPPKLTTVKSRIAKRTYFAHCPNVLSIHLSRSIFDYYSRKNSCKVAFPEELLLGPLLHRSKYKLLGLITHRGSHDSGHYECYRRQNSHPPPYSTPMIMPISGKAETATTPGTPITPATLETPTPVAETPVIDTPSASRVDLGEQSGESSGNTSGAATAAASTTALPLGENQGTTTGSTLPSGQKTVTATVAGKAAKADTLSLKSFPSKGKKGKGPDTRWWRISDDSIKEVKTGDVLGLQKEVYLLFYEKVAER